MNHEERAALKVGDAISLSPLYDSGRFTFYTIAKITKTQIVVHGEINFAGRPIEYRFNRVNGRQIGSHSTWRSHSLCTVAEGRARNTERDAERERSRMIERVKNLNWKAVDSRDIARILEEFARFDPGIKKVTKEAASS
jgi:hypothetical protein